MKYRILLQRLDDDDNVERSCMKYVTEQQSELIGLRTKQDGSQNKLDVIACARLLEHLFGKVNETPKCHT